MKTTMQACTSSVQGNYFTRGTLYCFSLVFVFVTVSVTAAVSGSAMGTSLGGGGYSQGNELSFTEQQ